MPDPYNPLNWYWSVQDNTPLSQVWSSAGNQYVLLTDTTYVAWLANGNSPTVIDTQLNLALVFDAVAENLHRFPHGAASGGDITLTNPLNVFQEVNSSTGSVTMPFVFSPIGLPRSVPFYIRNTHGSVTLTVKAFDGTSLGTLASQETGMLMLKANNDNTGAGLWRPLYHLKTS